MTRLPYDPRFAHVYYNHTDIRVGFKREEKRLKAIKEAKEKAEAEQRARDEQVRAEVAVKVAPLRG